MVAKWPVCAIPNLGSQNLSNSGFACMGLPCNSYLGGWTEKIAAYRVVSGVYHLGNSPQSGYYRAFFRDIRDESIGNNHRYTSDDGGRNEAEILIRKFYLLALVGEKHLVSSELISSFALLILLTATARCVRLQVIICEVTD